jgi:hypothetical protein
MKEPWFLRGIISSPGKGLFHHPARVFASLGFLIAMKR